LATPLCSTVAVSDLKVFWAVHCHLIKVHPVDSCSTAADLQCRD